MASSRLCLDDFESVIRECVEQEGLTYKDIEHLLKSTYNMTRGCSVRSIQNFCSSRGIHRQHGRCLTYQETDDIVAAAIEEVGPTYGRKMLTGFIRSRGIHIGEQRVRDAMRCTVPLYHTQRQNNTARQLNPVPYYAEYFGHKMHMDQNEKLRDFGVTHVLASDGYSGRIVAASSMPVKNNILIYEDVYRSACLTFGLWDQLRVDYGREFHLALYQQYQLRDMRRNTQRQPYIQSLSRQNHAAERHWVEVNARVNYPIKTVLVQMTNEDLLNMDDETTKFCVSSVVSAVCQSAMTNLIDAWNAHTIPGKGIPNVLSMRNECVQVTEDNLPTGDVLAATYRHEGGSICDFGQFGSDPLEGSPALQEQRTLRFHSAMPVLSEVMTAALHRNGGPLNEAVLTFIDITHDLTQEL